MSLRAVLTNIVKNPEYIQPDSLINDAEIPLAKNIQDFITNPTFIQNMFPSGLYPRQFEFAIKVLAEYCPYCSDMDWWGDTKHMSRMQVDESYDEILKRCVLLEHGVCPKCGRGRAEAYLEMKKAQQDEDYITPARNFYVPSELIGVMGQRSGKSALIAIIITYLIHWLLKTPNLQRTYKLLPASPFMIPLVALNFTKAKSLLFNPVKKYVLNGTWFKNYHKFLDLEKQRLGLSHKLWDVKETSISYTHKNLVIRPEVTDKRKLRGNTSLLGAIDELSHMHGATDGVLFDPDEIYTSLNNSMATAQTMFYKRLASGMNNVPVPLMISISSPAKGDDKAMQLYKSSFKSDRMYGINAPTWKVNPQQSFEVLKPYLDKDPNKFWRDFGADPLAGADAYFIPEHAISSAFENSSRENALRSFSFFRKSDTRIDKNTGLEVKYNYTAVEINLEDVKSICGVRTPLVMSLDCGEVNNSFSISLGAITNQNNFIVIGCGEAIGNPSYPINFLDVYTKVIKPLCKNLKVTLVVSDNWQSVMLKGSLKLENINYRTVRNMKYLDYSTFKDFMLSGAVTLPKADMDLDKVSGENLPNKMLSLKSTGTENYPRTFSNKPISHLIYQMLFVNDTGSSVIKTPDCTDDLLFTVVMLLKVLTSSEVDIKRFVQVIDDKVLSMPVSPISDTSIGARPGSGMSNSMDYSIGATFSSSTRVLSEGNQMSSGIGAVF